MTSGQLLVGSLMVISALGLRGIAPWTAATPAFLLFPMDLLRNTIGRIPDSQALTPRVDLKQEVNHASLTIVRIWRCLLLLRV